jgi:hypothetical protein
MGQGRQGRQYQGQLTPRGLIRFPLVPAQAGTQIWTPAFAGVSGDLSPYRRAAFQPAGGMKRLSSRWVGQ